jgi:hypothetical protein
VFQFLEGHLEKKIRVAEALYVYGGNIPKEKIRKKLDISNTTFNHYLSEVRQLYINNSDGSNYINSHTLIKATYTLMTQSVKSNLLYQLFLFPGNDAKYYKDKLSLTDATFARLIAQLKEDLQHFQVSIVVSNGYRIRGESEIDVCVLYTHLAVFFLWKNDDLLEQGNQLVGSEMMNKVKEINFSKYTFANGPHEEKFFRELCVIALVRQKQREASPNWQGYINCEVTLDKIINFLEQLWKDTCEKIRKSETKSENAIIPIELVNENIHRLKRLITLAAFQIQLFPYDLQHVPLRTYFFVRKLFSSNLKQAEAIKTILFRASTYYGIDFNLRQSMIVFFLVTEKLIVLEKSIPLQVFVYSSLGWDHQQYLIAHLGKIQSFFEADIQLIPYNQAQVVKDESECLYLSNQLLPTISLSRQFLISDYVSVTDYVRVIIWLKEQSNQTIY